MNRYHFNALLRVTAEAGQCPLIAMPLVTMLRVTAEAGQSHTVMTSLRGLGVFRIEPTIAI